MKTMKNFNLKSALGFAAGMTVGFIVYSFINHDYVMIKNGSATVMTIAQTIGGAVLRGIIFGIIMGFFFRFKPSWDVAKTTNI